MLFKSPKSVQISEGQFVYMSSETLYWKDLCRRSQGIVTRSRQFDSVPHHDFHKIMSGSSFSHAHDVGQNQIPKNRCWPAHRAGNLILSQITILLSNPSPASCGLINHRAFFTDSTKRPPMLYVFTAKRAPSGIRLGAT